MSSKMILCPIYVESIVPSSLLSLLRLLNFPI